MGVMVEGKKYDAGKAGWHLLPYDALGEVVQVLDFGAAKYGARNWERGMAWSRLVAALMRHTVAWMQGEEADPETGISHLAHAGCCVLFLLAYSMRQVGDDDRPSIRPLAGSARQTPPSA
jgi:hypothetical protein